MTGRAVYTLYLMHYTLYGIIRKGRPRRQLSVLGRVYTLYCIPRSRCQMRQRVLPTGAPCAHTGMQRSAAGRAWGPALLRSHEVAGTYTPCDLLYTVRYRLLPVPVCPPRFFLYSPDFNGGSARGEYVLSSEYELSSKWYFSYSPDFNGGSARGEYVLSSKYELSSK